MMVYNTQTIMDNTVGSQQRNIICGTLLGDGFLERNGKFVRLVIDHSNKQKEYVSWKANNLLPLVSKLSIKSRFDERTKRIYTHCVLRTRTSKLLEEFVSLFYRENRKYIPRDLPQMINPQILAVWIMDDGYRRNDCNALRLNTQSYAAHEQKIIQNALKQLALETTIQKHKSQFVVYIPSRVMTRLRTLVRPFIIPEMAYKIA